MKWNIDKTRPICPQIYEQMCCLIVNKKLLSREKIYSVRELAVKLGVNPNTVQKTYDLLEEKKIIFSVRGSGWYVSEDVSLAKEVLDGVIKGKINTFLEEMQQLGIDKNTVLNYLTESGEVCE